MNSIIFSSLENEYSTQAYFLHPGTSSSRFSESRDLDVGVLPEMLVFILWAFLHTYFLPRVIAPTWLTMHPSRR